MIKDNLALNESSNNIWKSVFSSLWETWRINVSQSHSLKRLSCSVASARPSMLNRGSNNIWKRGFSFIWDTWSIKVSQSHSLKRLSCSVASRRPNCITYCWTCTIINVWFTNSFVCKIRVWSSPYSLNNTKVHSKKLLTIIPSIIIDHKLWVTSDTFKSWHKKK